MTDKEHLQHLVQTKKTARLIFGFTIFMDLFYNNNLLQRNALFLQFTTYFIHLCNNGTSFFIVLKKYS